MIFGDYHTHTTYSHGNGSVEESVERAAELGIKELAITDHGFRHLTYNIKRKQLSSLVLDKLCAEEKHPDVKVFAGVEANILDGKGTIDINDDDLNSLDIIVCGYHKFVKNAGLGGFFGFSLPVLMSGLIRKSTQNRIVANTDAYIKAMEKYPIDIISHPGFGIKIDFKQVARAAAHFGTFLEINGKRISFLASDAHVMLEEGARFVINSDAHSPDRIGEVNLPMQFVRDAEIPFDCIANWDKQPVFRRCGRDND